MDQVAWARDLAKQLLAGPLPRRWSHVQGVGRKAESIAHIVGEDAETLICAAWLHDVGYAPKLVATRLHSLDGARYLRNSEHADGRLCRLVANHSFALFEARGRALAGLLEAEFPELKGLVADALTYCDMTTSPDGSPITLDQRLEEIIARYGKDHVVTKSIVSARPHIERSADRVSSALKEPH